MRSDISVKGVAYAQVAIYDALNAWTRESSPAVAKITAAFASTADILLDTLKHPATLLENVAMCAVNVAGASCSEECSMSDAANSLKLIGISSLTTVVAAIIAAPKWIIQTNRALSNPATIRSYNQLADQEAKLQWLVYTQARVLA